MADKASFINAALNIKAPLPPALLTRVWRQALAAKDWKVAANVASNPDLDGTLRERAAKVANSEVRTALLRRDDMDPEEAFRLCAGETRTSVLATLSRFGEDCPREYRTLLLASMRNHATVGVAKLLLDAADPLELHALDRDVAHPVLMTLSAAGGPSLTANQTAVVQMWVGAMRGEQVSTLLATAGVDSLIGRHSRDMMWLLLAEGRAEADIRADTAAWLKRNPGRDELVDVGTYMLRAMSRLVGGTRTLEIIGEVLVSTMAEAERPAELSEMQATVATALAWPQTGRQPATFGVPAVRKTSRAERVQPAPDSPADTDVIEVLEALLEPLTEVPVRVEGTIRIVANRYGKPRKGCEAASQAAVAAVTHDDLNVSARGWILASRYQLSVEAVHCRQGWHVHAGNPDVEAALLSLWHSGVGLSALPIEAVAGIACASVESGHGSPQHVARTLHRTRGGAIDELVKRGRVAAVPWQSLAAAVRAGEDAWRLPARVGFEVPGKAVEWMAARIETANDPGTVWTMVESIGEQFPGTVGELLSAAADSAGEHLNLGVSVKATPVRLETF